MTRYEAEIIPGTEGFTIKTKGLEENEQSFRTIDEVRRSLVREKFNLEANKWMARRFMLAGGVTIGIGLFAPQLFGINQLDKIVSGGIAFYLGQNWRKESTLERPAIEERISAFHRQYPELNPIRFSFREYLSTFKLGHPLPVNK